MGSVFASPPQVPVSINPALELLSVWSFSCSPYVNVGFFDSLRFLNNMLKVYDINCEDSCVCVQCTLRLTDGDLFSQGSTTTVSKMNEKYYSNIYS